MFTTSETRAVQQLSTPGGSLAVVAADQRASLRTMFERVRTDSNRESLVEFKRAPVRALAPAASAMLLDPEIALPDVIDGGLVARATGLLVSLEVSGAVMNSGLYSTTLLPGFGPAGVRRMGGTAAKLLVRSSATRSWAARAGAAWRSF